MPANAQFVIERFDRVYAYFGLGPVWLATALFIVGLVTIFRLGRPATALTAMVLMPEMLIVSALKKYPFLDLRTSTFLFTVVVVVAAIGIAGVAWLVRPWAKGRIATAFLVLAPLTFVVHAQPFIRAHTIPSENVRDQARYVAIHAAPNDTTLVSSGSSWGFAYYWPTGHPSGRPSTAFQRYQVYFPGQSRIVVAHNRNAVAVDEGLTEARAMTVHREGARIWLIRTHVSRSEEKVWDQALNRLQLTAKPVGHDGLSVIQVN